MGAGVLGTAPGPGVPQPAQSAPAAGCPSPRGVRSSPTRITSLLPGLWCARCLAGPTGGRAPGLGHRVLGQDTSLRPPSVPQRPPRSCSAAGLGAGMGQGRSGVRAEGPRMSLLPVMSAVNMASVQTPRVWCLCGVGGTGGAGGGMFCLPPLPWGSRAGGAGTSPQLLQPWASGVLTPWGAKGVLG